MAIGAPGDGAAHGGADGWRTAHADRGGIGIRTDGTPGSGGRLIGGPSVVLVPPGVLSSSQTSQELAVFGRGTDNALWWTHQTASGWTGWQSLGGILTSKPSAAASLSGDHGKLAVFVRGNGGQIWYRSLGTSSWNAWTYLSGELLAGTGPSATYDNNGHLIVAAVGTAKDVYLWAQFAGFGFAFGDIGGVTASDPSVAFVNGTASAPNSKQAVVFVRGANGALWSKQVSIPVPNLNGAWNSLGGSLTSGIGADSSGVTYVFALGTDNQVWMRGGAWPSPGAWTRV